MDLIEIKYIVSPDYDMDNLRNRRLSESEIFELSNIFKEKQSAFDNAPNKRSCERPISTALQCAIWIQLSTICRSGEMLMAMGARRFRKGRVVHPPRKRQRQC
jgi:hypothetical protein